MDLTLLADIARLAMFVIFSAGFALLLVINVVAFRSLQMPRNLSILFWHLIAISLSFLCLGVVALDRVIGDLGEPPTWRTPTVLVGVISFTVSQVFIFGMERQRMIYLKALEQRLRDDDS